MDPFLYQVVKICDIPLAGMHRSMSQNDLRGA